MLIGKFIFVYCRERTLKATSVSKNTLQKIQKESQYIEYSASTSFGTPHKERPRKSRKMDAIRVGTRQTIRDIVHDFYIIEKRRPTLNCE